MVEAQTDHILRIGGAFRRRERHAGSGIRIDRHESTWVSNTDEQGARRPGGAVTIYVAECASIGLCGKKAIEMHGMRFQIEKLHNSALDFWTFARSIVAIQKRLYNYYQPFSLSISVLTDMDDGAGRRGTICRTAGFDLTHLERIQHLSLLIGVSRLGLVFWALITTMLNILL